MYHQTQHVQMKSLHFRLKTNLSYLQGKKRATIQIILELFETLTGMLFEGQLESKVTC